jgi:hypothetical protein
MHGCFLARIGERLWGADISPLADQRLIGSIGAFFGWEFSAVRFRRGGILPYVVPFPYSAVVFGNTVNVRRGAEPVLRDPRVMAEELFHVIQWARMGPVRMAAAYPFYHLVRGYAGNPIEREAKQRADAYCTNCANRANCADRANRAPLKSATQRTTASRRKP